MIARELRVDVCVLMDWIRAHPEHCKPRAPDGRRRRERRINPHLPQLYLNSERIRELIIERLRIRPPLTLTQIAKEFSCSRQRISQIVDSLAEHPAYLDYRKYEEQVVQAEIDHKRNTASARLMERQNRKEGALLKLQEELKPARELWRKGYTLNDIADMTGIPPLDLSWKIHRVRKIYGEEWFPRRHKQRGSRKT